MTESEQSERFAFPMFHLIHGALARRFVRTPAHNFCSVPESITREMIVAHFHNDFRIDRLPFAGAFRAPTTRPARRIAGEPRRFSQRFEFLRQGTTISALNAEVNPT